MFRETFILLTSSFICSLRLSETSLFGQDGWIVVKMAGYWPRFFVFFLARLWTSTPKTLIASREAETQDRSILGSNRQIIH